MEQLLENNFRYVNKNFSSSASYLRVNDTELQQMHVHNYCIIGNFTVHSAAQN